MLNQDLVPAPQAHLEIFARGIAALSPPVALLISAFDVFYGLADPFNSRIPDGARLYDALDLLLIDSGQWEARAAVQEPVNETAEQIAWNEERLRETANRAEAGRSVLVNLDPLGDGEHPYEQQFEQAVSFFRDYPHFTSDFLLKPEGAAAVHDPEDVLRVVRRMDSFDVVGFTEDELGYTLGDRLRTLAGARSAMDDAGITAPIHVFGALDPVSIPLYFGAGAELFDGLSWIKYAFYEGFAVRGEAFAALDRDSVEHAPGLTAGRRMHHNLLVLQELRTRLRTLAYEDAWGQFEHGDMLRQVLAAALRSERN